MNETRPTNDDLHDAATDRLLAEALAGESPPDLRDAIVEQYEQSKTEIAPRKRSTARFLVEFVVCASLLGVGAWLLLPSVQASREAARRSQALSEARQRAIEAEMNAAVPPLSDESGLRFREAPPTDQSNASKPGLVLVQPVPDLVEINEELGSADRPKIMKRELSRDVHGRGRGMAVAPSALASQPAPGEQTFGVDAIIVYDGPADQLAAAPAPASSRSRDAGIAGRRVQPDFYDGNQLKRHQDLSREPLSRDRYTAIVENPFKTAQGGDAVSTFSIDVDTASYANVRQYLLSMNQLPPADAVRIEELVNYFDYAYQGPEPNAQDPFAAAMEVGPCPWTPEHRLVRIGVKGREIEFDKRPLSNLVFLVDVSGSMNEPNKLPLLVDGLKRLTRQLGENDRVAIVVYASSEGLALDSTNGSERGTILAALDKLRAGGSTAGGAGIQLAYDVAERNSIEGGVNRVLLCTDGDFNVGVTDTDALGNLVENKAKQTGVFLSVLGFGRGNLNDAMMETISGRGNGVYSYIDSDREAHRVLVRQMSGTLVTIAKDVKLQVEFNPTRVAKYRLLGYENRMLKTEDFNDDTKDAGEIGAGHTVTALYEVVPVGATSSPVIHEPLKYQQGVGERESGAGEEESLAESPPPTAFANELLTLKIRYKRPDESESTKLEFPLVDGGEQLSAASPDFKFACSVAEFGMLLRNSPHKGAASFDGVLELAEQGLGDDPHDDRSEFVGLVRKAKQLRGE